MDALRRDCNIHGYSPDRQQSTPKDSGISHGALTTFKADMSQNGHVFEMRLTYLAEQYNMLPCEAKTSRIMLQIYPRHSTWIGLTPILPTHAGGYFMFNWSFEKRVMRRVKIDENGCWNWLGGKVKGGYGQIGIGGKTMVAHRYAYTVKIGPVPRHLDLDHLCRNRACVNPSHLEPVTRQVNLLRGLRMTQVPKKQNCLRGHPLSTTPSGYRVCHECQSMRARKKYWSRRLVNGKNPQH